MSKAATIAIRPCTRLEEYDRCVELQRLVWGFADVELVPKDVIVVAGSTGGQVFGAFNGAEMIGFLLSFPGYRNGRAYIHSHMLAVLPDYRDAGVGRRLKLEQRSDALARGLELVEWTFDPLELKNAYFNIERLGAIVRRYIVNKYGRTTSPLHAGLPTDRLVAEWWLKTPRVESVVTGGAVPHAPGSRRIAVPVTVAQLKGNDRATAERLQAEVREQFQKSFAEGYAVTGFEATADAGVYLLEPTPAGIPR
jgi:predicted GNAT superfamily acetyltransferase